MPVATSAGTTLHVSPGNPATYDAAGYATLFSGSPAELVGEITDLGEFGREYALVTHNPVGNRGTQKFKGSFNEGSMSLQLGLDNTDAGQIVMKAASLSDDAYSFKVTLQGGDSYYFQGKVMTWKMGVGSVDQITTASATIELTTNDAGVGVIEDPAS